MTLLSICQNVAADLGVAVPKAPIFGSQVPAAQRLYAQARRSAMSLARHAPWVSLVIEHTFTSTGVSDYPLPPDFGWMIDNTLWERSRYWSMRGALSPQQWQRYKSSLYGRATLWRRWRIRVPSGSGAGTAATFSIDPALGAQDVSSQFVFEYVSRYWCRSATPPTAGQATPDWTGDNDTALLDENLLELGTRWRMLRRLGLAYDEDKDEYDREVDRAKARDGGTAILELVPSAWRDEVGQFTLAAFPPVPPTPIPPIEPVPPVNSDVFITGYSVLGGEDVLGAGTPPGADVLGADTPPAPPSPATSRSPLLARPLRPSGPRRRRIVHPPMVEC